MGGQLVLESCHSTWVFDEGRMRFRRMLKGLDDGRTPPVTGWRPYYGLELSSDSDAFVVLLNPQGTRMLRSWRHLNGGCQACDERTSELSVEAVRHSS